MSDDEPVWLIEKDFRELDSGWQRVGWEDLHEGMRTIDTRHGKDREGRITKVALFHDHAEVTVEWGDGSTTGGRIDDVKHPSIWYRPVSS